MADPFRTALSEAGGIAAPRTATAQLRGLLSSRLVAGAAELRASRSGTRELPVVAVVAALIHDGAPGLAAVAPVDERLRADPERAGERGWLLAAALVGALVDASDARPPTDSSLLAGALEGSLALWMPAREPDPEFAAEAFGEAAARIDRLRAVALAVPPFVVEGIAGLRPPPGRPPTPFQVAEAVARLRGDPADPASVERHADALAGMFQGGCVARPHDDPVPERRIARRILQRLAGMGKWGGYHTEVSHLARGFEGNERALAREVGERLVAAGLLAEKQSVGQRHVFLDPRRAGEIWALIDDGLLPAGLDLA